MMIYYPVVNARSTFLFLTENRSGEYATGTRA